MIINQLRTPNHPGKILKELYMKPLNFSITNLAYHLKVSRKTISKIINGRGSITPEMALRLSNAFNTTPNIWLNLQQNYDLWHIRTNLKDWKQVKKIPCSLAHC